MTVEIPVSWVSYCPDNPERGRWDQLHLERVLNGEEGRPSFGFTFVDTPWTPGDGRGRVVVFSAGHYHDHSEVRPALERLIGDLYKLEWCVLFATSDECQTFPWHTVDPWPSHVQLWVQLPRPENKYPPGTRFFGEGSPHDPKVIAGFADEHWSKPVDVFFSGQMGHERREQMWKALAPMRDDERLNVVAHATDGFLQGMEIEDYLTWMASAKIVPCPSGICSQSSFRAFEALEAQCIPVVDELRPSNAGYGYWSKIGMDGCGLAITDWSTLRQQVEDLVCLNSGLLAPVVSNNVQASWQQYKRRFVTDLHDDVRRHVAVVSSVVDDMITVVVPTSPVPSNPSLDIILETIASIRERLPEAEILVTCDGVRDEQPERARNYHEYVRRLLAWTNTQPNITPFVMPAHRHQSGMMREIIGRITTPYLLYVEHDCPLVGEIPFDDILNTMIAYELSLMRFYHEVATTEGSEHLFLDRHRNYIQTIQWSQRPHLAETKFYANIIGTYFGPDSRTMIEDVMHGVVQADAPADPTCPGGIRASEAWKRWRMALYAPEGSWKRSTHLDARGDDPKYPMLVSYPDHQRPQGAPPEGWVG